MKNNKSIVAGAAAGAFAGVLVLAGIYYVATGRESAEPPTRTTAAVVENDGYTPADPPPAQVSVQPLANLAPVDEQAMHDHDDPEVERLREQEKLIKNEARWNLDAPAPIESTKLEQTLLSAAGSESVEQVRFKPEKLEVQCKSSMCRIETEFARGADTTEWATRLLLTTGAEFGNVNFVGERLPDGKERMVMYSYRLGTNPPQ